MITFECASCGHKELVDDELAGKQAKCCKCGFVGQIAGTSAPSSMAELGLNQFRCPGCGHRLAVKAGSSIKDVQCPQCNQWVAVPVAATTAAGSEVVLPGRAQQQPDDASPVTFGPSVTAVRGWRNRLRRRKSIAAASRSGNQGRVILIAGCSVFAVILAVVFLRDSEHPSDRQAASCDSPEPVIAAPTAEPVEHPEVTTTRPSAPETPAQRPGGTAQRRRPPDGPPDPKRSPLGGCRDI